MIRVFGTADKTFTSNGDAVIRPLKAKVHKEDNTLQFKVAITLDEPFTPGTYYGYDINDIAADHVIVVTASSSGPVFYVKQGSSWVAVTKVYRKANNAWTEIDPSTLDSTAKYVRA